MNKPKPHAIDNILTPEEIEKCKEACKTEAEKILFYGLLYTGMRISEFIHLRKEWVEKEFISIPETQKCGCYECRKQIERKGKIIKPSGYWKVKTEAGKRIIFILPELKEILESYLNKHNSIMEVIPNRVYAWEIIKRISKKAGVKHLVFPHSLRSTYATILASKGFDALRLKNIMGWTKITMAEQYIRFDKSGIKKMFEDTW